MASSPNSLPEDRVEVSCTNLRSLVHARILLRQMRETPARFSSRGPLSYSPLWSHSVSHSSTCGIAITLASRALTATMPAPIPAVYDIPS